MKVLLFSAFDPIPSDEAETIRYAPLAEVLLERGHEVRYVTSSFFHLKKARRKNSWSALGNPAGLQLQLIPASAYEDHTGIKRIYSYYILAQNLKRYLAQLPESDYPDVVLSASPPLRTAAVLAGWARAKGIPFVLDIQDLWPYSFEQFLPVPAFTRFLLGPLKRTAQRTVRQASAVASVSSDYLKFYQNELSGKPSQVFPLGTDTSLFPEVFSNESLKRAVYIGNGQRNPLLFTAMDALGNQPGWRLDLVGTGPASHKLIEYTRQRDYTNIEVTPWMAFPELAQQLPGYDVGLLLVNPENRIAFPNKAFTYLAAGLPLLSNLVGGELEELIKAQDLGHTIHEVSSQNILRNLEAMPADFPLAEHRRIQAFARKAYDKNMIYVRYCLWLESLFGHNP